MEEFAGTLVLARHGATDSNLSDPPLLQGKGVDHGLSERGSRQAAALAKALAGRRFDAVVASPMKRARATAAAVARHQGLNVRTLPELHEVDIGTWENHSWRDIAAQWPTEHAAFLDDAGTHGYLGGETMSDVRDRCDGPLRRLLAGHPGGTVLAVAHNVVNRVLLCHWMDIPVRHARKVPQHNTGYSIVRYAAGDGLPKMKVLTINRTEHLAGELLTR